MPPQPTELEPRDEHAAGDETPAAHPVTEDTPAGVAVTAYPDAWTGWDAIAEVVTPLRVGLRNDSSDDVLITYASFTVSGQAEGQPVSYRAVPPWQMDASAEGVLPERYPAVAAPAFVHERFQVAPLYARIYPGIGAVGPTGFDPGYYGGFEGFWVETELPTVEMMSRVLPEGVIEAGGHLEGVLFFERVDPAAEELVLHAQLDYIDPDHTPTVVSIPVVLVEE